MRSLAWTAGLLGLWALSLWMERPVAPTGRAASLGELALWAELGPEIPLEDDALRVLGVDVHRFVRHEAAGERVVWVYAGYYAGQRRDAQVHAPEHCYPGSGYRILRSTRDRVERGEVRELLVQRGDERRLVWFAYRTRHGGALSPFGLKRDQILAALTGRPRDALLLRLSTPLAPLEEDASARARLREDWSAIAGSLWNWFEEGES